MKNSMQEALRYFKEMGMPIKNGYIDAEALTEEQIEILEKWKKETDVNGIMMPEEQDFYRSVLLATSLYPQKNQEGQIQYLFGKGIGVEIALRGTIEGRRQYETQPPYRSHSDFELYDSNGSYTEEFYRVFEAQEYYPPTETKGLKEIPEGYMDKTHETVMIDGYEVLVPQLEILFLDKFLKKESTPRDGVYDCELLAEKYELDVSLIERYLKKHCFQVEAEQQREGAEGYKKRFSEHIIRNLENEDGYADLESAIKSVNMEIQNWGKATVALGIRIAWFVELTTDDVFINEAGEIELTPEYIQKTIARITDKTEKDIADRRKTTLEELKALFARVEQKRKNVDLVGLDEYAGLAYDSRTVETVPKGTQAMKQAVQTIREGIEQQTNEEGGPSLE